MTRKILALLLISVFVLVPAGTASAAKLKRGIYDCVGSSTGNYVNSVKIKRDNKYLWAAGRDGAKLLDPSPGTYRVDGDKIRWKTGVYKRANRVSTIYDGYFSIDRKSNGTWTGISCYLQ